MAAAHLINSLIVFTLLLVVEYCVSVIGQCNNYEDRLECHSLADLNMAGKTINLVSPQKKKWGR